MTKQEEKQERGKANTEETHNESEQERRQNAEASRNGGDVTVDTTFRDGKPGNSGEDNVIDPAVVGDETAEERKKREGRLASQQSDATTEPTEPRINK